MNNRKVHIALGLIASILAIVSVLVLFTTAFGDSDTMGNPSSLGSCYDVMFGAQEYSAVPLLIAAFVMQCTAIAFGLLGTFLPGKLGAFGLGLTALLLVISGVFWILAPTAFLGVNSVSAEAEIVQAGTGSILAIVFCFLGGLLSLYGAYRSFKD